MSSARGAFCFTCVHASDAKISGALEGFHRQMLGELV